MIYQLGHIYKIVCNLDFNICYIGSTFRRLDKRWQKHKNDYKSNYGEISIHKYFDKYGIENFKIVLIKSYNLVRADKRDSKHLWAYETLHINKNKKNIVNTQLPFSPMRYLNIKKWRENNKDKIAKKHKEWYQNNKDKISEKSKKKIICQCGMEMKSCSLSNHLKSKKHINLMNKKKNSL
tara:strand:- start:449 stop:988 length:540 start_codon:yes stop_codon:yes gene_type:complete